LRSHRPVGAGLALLWLTIVGLVGIARADPPVPPLTGRVMDVARVLDPEAVGRLTAELESFERQKQIQLVIVTIPDLQGYTIEDWGLALGRGWGIGQKGKNNGVLLLVAPKDRQLRIEVGYGLEGDLPDAEANRIIQDQIIPRLRNGEMAAGIEAGAQTIITTLGGKISGAKVAPVSNLNDGGGALAVPIVFFIFMVIILLNARRRRGPWGGYYPYGGGFGRGGFSSGGSSGGFSGGGGSFGGGGASGRW